MGATLIQMQEAQSLMQSLAAPNDAPTVKAMRKAFVQAWKKEAMMGDSITVAYRFFIDGTNFGNREMLARKL